MFHMNDGMIDQAKFDWQKHIDYLITLRYWNVTIEHPPENFADLSIWSFIYSWAFPAAFECRRRVPLVTSRLDKQGN